MRLEPLAVLPQRPTPPETLQFLAQMGYYRVPRPRQDLHSGTRDLHDSGVPRTSSLPSLPSLSTRRHDPHDHRHDGARHRHGEEGEPQVRRVEIFAVTGTTSVATEFLQPAPPPCEEQAGSRARSAQGPRPNPPETLQFVAQMRLYRTLRSPAVTSVPSQASVCPLLALPKDAAVDSWGASSSPG